MEAQWGIKPHSPDYETGASSQCFKAVVLGEGIEPSTSPYQRDI